MIIDTGLLCGEKVLHVNDATLSVVFDNFHSAISDGIVLTLDGFQVAVIAGAGELQFRRAYKAYTTSLGC